MFKSLNLFYTSAFFKSQILLLPILYLFYLSNGLTLKDYLLFQGLVVLVNVALQIPIGVLSNYVSRKTLIVLSYFIYLLRIGLWLFAQGYWIVLIGEMFLAVSKSLFDATEAPYIYEVLKSQDKENEMLKSYSKLNFALCLGVCSASIVGTYLYKIFNSDTKIILLTELIIMTIAILLSFFMPKVKPNSKYKYSIEKFKQASIMLFKSKQFIIPILYSALLVSFSHFFFWSFQPLMKTALVSVTFFGIILFINNIIRALGSYYTSFISKYITFSNHGITCFILNSTAFILFCFLLNSNLNKILCLSFIFYLCICIAMQLSFTIRQTSFLQKKSLDSLRGYVASVNMFFARAAVGIILIAPKYFMKDYSLNQIYFVYFIVFVIISLILLTLFYGLFKNYEKENNN